MYAYDIPQNILTHRTVQDYCFWCNSI